MSTYTRTRAMVVVELGTGSGNWLTLDPVEGDVSLTGLRPGYKSRVALMSRGTYQGSVEGDDEMPAFEVTLRHKGHLSSATVKTVKDLIMHTGAYASDITTDPEGTWNIQARMTITGADGVDVITMPNVEVPWDYSTGESNTLKLSGTCYRASPTTDPVIFT